MRLGKQLFPVQSCSQQYVKRLIDITDASFEDLVDLWSENGFLGPERSLETLLLMKLEEEGPENFISSLVERQFNNREMPSSETFTTLPEGHFLRDYANFDLLFQLISDHVSYDTRTGFYNDVMHSLNIGLSSMYSQVTGEPVTLVETDLINVKNVGHTLGYETTLQLTQTVINIIHNTLKEASPDATILTSQLTSDSFGLVCADMPMKVVEQAMEKVTAEVISLIVDLGLSNISHSKNPLDTTKFGTGFGYGVVDLAAVGDYDEATDSIDKQTKTSKKQCSIALSVAATGQPNQPLVTNPTSQYSGDLTEMRKTVCDKLKVRKTASKGIDRCPNKIFPLITDNSPCSIPYAPSENRKRSVLFSARANHLNNRGAGVFLNILDKWFDAKSLLTGAKPLSMLELDFPQLSNRNNGQPVYVLDFNISNIDTIESLFGSEAKYKVIEDCAWEVSEACRRYFDEDDPAIHNVYATTSGVFKIAHPDAVKLKHVLDHAQSYVEDAIAEMTFSEYFAKIGVANVLSGSHLNDLVSTIPPSRAGDDMASRGVSIRQCSIIPVLEGTTFLQHLELSRRASFNPHQLAVGIDDMGRALRANNKNVELTMMGVNAHSREG